MNYIKKKPKKPTFSQKGLDGFMYNLEDKNLEVYYTNSRKGHDDFVIANTFSHIYYVLSGKGIFIINNKKYKVRKGMLVEIPPKVEFAHSGKMEFLEIINPPFDAKNIKITRSNLK